MTQPLCAYEGCGKLESHRIHDLTSESPFTHEFQPESTVESAPVSQHKPGCPRYSGVGECDCFDDIPASTSPQGAGELQRCIGFEAIIRFRNATIENVSLEGIHFAIGTGMDSAGLQEEIDYTVEVKRIYE